MESRSRSKVKHYGEHLKRIRVDMDAEASRMNEDRDSSVEGGDIHYKASR